MALKITIVTVTLNKAEALSCAINSVLAQSYDNIEHIIVDGYSSDGTTEIVTKYPKLKFIQAAPAGVYDALNQGIKTATGDIVGLLHSDDVLSSPDVIERVAQEFENDPDLDFIYGDMRYVKPLSNRTTRIYHASEFQPSELSGGIAPPHPTLYMRRTVAEHIGEYSTDYDIAGDFEMWCRLFKDKSLKYKYLPMIMVNMATGGLSSTLKARLFINNQEKLRALRANGLPARPMSLLRKYFMIARDFIKDKSNE